MGSVLTWCIDEREFRRFVFVNGSNVSPQRLTETKWPKGLSGLLLPLRIMAYVDITEDSFAQLGNGPEELGWFR
jgi:hypothetical protein